jgi:GNAT superfamily N-acetyltransferase
MKFVSVYDRKDAADILFALLKERDPVANISHVTMPTWEQHCAFIASRPYKEWHLIEAGNDTVGACYVSKQNEIGIFIFAQHQGKGYGRAAVRKVLDAHPGERMLANVAPLNDRSRAMFEGLGFRHVQNTFALTTPSKVETARSEVERCLWATDTPTERYEAARDAIADALEEQRQADAEAHPLTSMLLCEIKNAPPGVSCAIDWNYTERVWEGSVISADDAYLQNIPHVKSTGKTRVLLEIKNGNLEQLKADLMAHVAGLS